jgi:hypothetical protein
MLVSAVALAALAAGCGGDDTKTVTRTVSAPLPSTTATTPPSRTTDDSPAPPETTPTTDGALPPTTTEAGPSQADAEDAARTAANDYTRDRYGISGEPSDWSAACTGEGDVFSCAMVFNGGQCAGRLTLTGSDLTPGNERLGCRE